MSCQPLAIITGASSGIGAALSERIAERGYRTVLIARRRRLMEVIAERNRRYAVSDVEPLDLSQHEKIGPAMRRILSLHGPADVLVNCAGAGMYKTFLEHDTADHLRLMQVNYFAALEMIRLALPDMLERGRGTVLNIASMSAKIGPWGHSAYAASKTAMVSLTQTLAAEHAGSGVHFCYVTPGIVRTEYFNRAETRGLWPVVERHAMEVGPVADRILTLLDRPRLELCIPGHYRCLDWIKALSVGWAHRLVRRGSQPLPPLPTPGRVGDKVAG